VGVANGEDAAEYLLAGACSVEVGTANFRDPEAPVRIATELDALAPKSGAKNASNLIWKLKDI
jgi:dihydroorotate dehydrogenase (NAD+) catalytic subunit